MIDKDRRENYFKKWENIGVDIIKEDLKNGGFTYIGGTLEVRQLAIEWVLNHEKEKERNNKIKGITINLGLFSFDIGPLLSRALYLIIPKRFIK